MKVLKFIIDIFRKYPKLCWSNVAVSIAMSFFGIFTLFSLSPIIDIFLHPDMKGLSPLTLKVTGIMKACGLPVTLTGLILVFIIFASLSCILQVISMTFTLRMKYAITVDSTIDSFEDFFSARWFFFSSSEQCTIYNTFNREMQYLGNGFTMMGMMFSSVIQVFVLLVVPFYISWKVTVLCFGFGILVSSFSFLLGKSTYFLGRKSTETANKLSGVIYENISFAKLVLGYGNKKELIQNLKTAYDTHLGYAIRSQIINYALTVSYRPIGIIVAAIVLISSRWFLVPLSEVTVLLLALFQVTLSLCNFISYKNYIINIVPSYEQIKALREKACSMKQFSGSKIFSGFKKNVSIDNLTFLYPGHSEILRGVSLVVPKGKMVAVVGRSGAGKSTLIDILMGLHEPTTGRVMIDGCTLMDYDITSYRRKLGYVPQESVLFNMSVRDNLLWSRSSASQEEIVKVCRLAHADEFIDNLPQGYDTIVGDRGVRLSGGQVQRLALARAFLREPEILILDEATSSLDSHSEKLIQKAIENVSKKTTVVVVAHRFATIKQADIIYVLDKGLVVEQGSYEELIAIDGYFSEMAQLQKLGIAI